MLTQPALYWSLGTFSVFAVVCSIVLVPRYLASLPPDYLHGGARGARQHVALRILRNALGALLVVLGLLMLVLPGQGLITLLVGVLLLDFPGKQRLVRGLLGRPKVLEVVNKLRARHGSPPLSA
jgi:Putative transmembrane protein (PGPGW)